MNDSREVASMFASILPINEQVVTVWKDGTWKVWGAMDAFYAQSDDDYLVTIALKELAAQDTDVYCP